MHDNKKKHSGASVGGELSASEEFQQAVNARNSCGQLAGFRTIAANVLHRYTNPVYPDGVETLRSEMHFVDRAKVPACICAA